MNLHKSIIFLFLLFSFAVFSQNQTKHKVVSGESIYSIAKKYKVSEVEIYNLNSNVKGKILQLNTVLIIPKSKSHLNETHAVELGESFFTIAKKYDLSIDELQKMNPEVLPQKLQIGTKLFLKKVIVSTVDKNTKKVIEKSSEKQLVTEDVIHKVKKRETLGVLAKKYDLRLSELKSLNPNLGKNLPIGYNLIVKKGEVISQIIKEIKQETIVLDDREEADDNIEEADDSGDITHIVQKGETLNKVAKQYNLKLKTLKKLNPGLDDHLSIGHKLLVKKGETANNLKYSVAYEESEEDAEDVSSLSEEGLSLADKLIERASEQIGARYRSGGTSSGGFDCSGLMVYTYTDLSFKLPRSSASQSKYGKKIKKDKAQKGDLIFFTTNGRGNINHVGMITDVKEGEIKFIHASVRSGVVVSSTNESYYKKRFVKIVRVL